MKTRIEQQHIYSTISLFITFAVHIQSYFIYGGHISSLACWSIGFQIECNYLKGINNAAKTVQTTVGS